MPKVNSARIADAQRQRQHISKKSEKFEKYGPSTIYLQVLGSGARGAPNTLYLFTDQKRYLFNCGECTQRLAHEHKVKLSKLDHIFITSKTWKNIGGLPGLSLTLQDVGVPKITLHGPDGLDELYNATKRFVIMKDMQVTMAKCSPSEDFEDNVMSVKYVLLAPSVSLLPKDVSLKSVAKKPRLSDVEKEYEEFAHDNTDYYRPKNEQKRPLPKSRITEKAPDPKKKPEKVLMDLQNNSQCSVAYICTLKKRLGTLDLAKCVERGVKPGPMLGQLKLGHDVILPDGSLVMSKDVKTPDDPGPVFIVLDLQDISYLKEADFSAHFNNGVNPQENIPTLIVHMTPPNVYHHPTYKAFMSMFGPTTRHLILNSQNSCLGSEAVHRTQHKLHLLDSDIFPLLRDASVPAEWNAHPPVPKSSSPVKLKGFEDLKNRIAIAQFQSIINMESSYGDGAALAENAGAKLETYSARTLTMFHLRPKQQLDRSVEPKLHVQDYYQETMDVDGFVGSLEQFRRVADGLRYEKSSSMKEYPKVVFLGTGSCIPSKTRNTSGILLHIDKKNTILLDCGEGTFGQMVRFYGPRKVNDVLRSLKAIYISHLHADHHIGLIGVLQARFEAFENSSEQSEPVFLMAPGQIVSWLTVYDQHFERISSEFKLTPNQSLMNDAPQREMSSANLAAIGVEHVSTCLVPHCPNAFGVALTVAGHKITYSGDTLPTQELVKIGENSTVLIHEATMEDELAVEARVKMHSTTSQAIEIGRKMNAKFTVLTHFSQRYARLPRLNSNMLHANNSVGIAFDNMQITISDLELLPHMYAPLQLMFAEHCVEMELKAEHRERRKERRAASPTLAPGGDQVAKRRSSFSRGAVKPEPVPVVQSRSPIQYRESNSSRLRQQLRGMPILGEIGSPRSKSRSPSKQSRPSTGPASGESSCTTPRNKSPDKSMDLIHTPRSTISASSCISRDAQELLRIISHPASCCVYDISAKSKVINNNANPNNVNVKVNSNSTDHCEKSKQDVELRKTSTSNCVTPQVAAESGYGKPLVIPKSRKLVIKRDTAHLSPSPTRPSNDNKPAPNNLRSKRSQIRSWKAENSVEDPKKATGTVSKNYNAGNKSPNKTNKLRSSLTNFNARSDSKISPKIAAVGSAARPQNSSYTRYSKSPTKSTTESDGRLTAQNKSNNKTPKARDTRSWSPETGAASKSQIPIRRSSNPIPVEKNTKGAVKDSEKNPRKDNASNVSKPVNRDINQVPFSNCKANVGHQSSKGFKPQLEDIKSSYLLLNSNNMNQDRKTKAKKDDSGRKLPPVQKPPPLNEAMRKAILLESKAQFKSKRFWNESSMSYV